jgi:hypothetical protein
MADESKLLGQIGIDEAGQASVREPIFINLSRFKNSRYLDIRKFYEKDGEWKPTTKGITLHGDQLEELIRILTENKEEILLWTAGKPE